MIPDGVQFTTDLDDLLATLVTDGEPGLSVGVYSDGALVAAASAGLALLEHGVPLTSHSVFDIASKSKHFTAVCVLLLVRDGRLDLDADIRGYLPELDLQHPVTLRHCLTHTGGLREYLSLCDIAGVPQAGMREDRMLALIAGQRELNYPLGSSWSYANTGYLLCAAIIRRVTGASIAEFARTHVFEPLGMTATRFRDDVGVLVPSMAASYEWDGDAGDTDTSTWRRSEVTEEVVGDGALITSIEDLAAWHGFMATGAVLGLDIRDGLRSRPTLTDGTLHPYAFGVETYHLAGAEAWWHSGSMCGYRTAVMYLFDAGIGVSVLANRNDIYPSHLAAAIARSLVTGESVASCHAALRGVPASGGDPEAVAGRWYCAAGDEVMGLSAEGSDVVIDGARYRWCSDGRWHGVGTGEGGALELVLDEMIEVDTVSGAPMRRFTRVSAADGSAAPVGVFHSAELNAYAFVTEEPAIRIGVAPTVTLEAVADVAGGVAWNGDGRTVRATADGITVSMNDAVRVAFRRVERADESGVVRGLRA